MRKIIWKKRAIAWLLLVTLAGTGLMPLAKETVFEVQAKAGDVKEIEWQYQTIIKEGMIYAQIVGMIGEAEELELPMQLDGYPVGSIAKGAFQGNASLKRIVLPSTLYEIGDSAFAACTALKTVELSKQLMNLHIGADAFLNCVSLEWTVFPCEIELEDGAFRNCSSIDNLTFEENATLSGGVFEGAFVQSEAKKKIVFEKDVTMYTEENPEEITNKKAPLANCFGLNEVEIKGNAKIDDYMFYNNQSLEKITFGAGLEMVKDNLVLPFSNCESLKTLEFQSENINVQGVLWDDTTALETIIFKTDIDLKKVQPFCKASKIVFERNVVISEKTNIAAREVYFYDSGADIKNLENSCRNWIAYGLENSNITQYVNEKMNVTFVDIVEEIKVIKGRNTPFLVTEGDLSFVTEKDLELKVFAKYRGIEESEWIPVECQGSNLDIKTVDYKKGYMLEYGVLKNAGTLGIKNTILVRYSGHNTALNDIEVKSEKIVDIDVCLVTGAAIIEGAVLDKSKVTVLAVYESGNKKVVAPSDYILSQEILLAGNSNVVTVEYEGFQKQLKNINAKMRSLIRIEAEYMGQSVIVGTEFSEKDLKVTAVYDNGLKEEQNDFRFLGSRVIEKVGMNKVLVEYAGQQDTVDILGMADSITHITVTYSEEWVAVGGKIDENCIQVTAHLMSGKIKENVPFILENYTIALGASEVRVYYVGELPLVSAESGVASIIAKGVALEVVSTRIVPITNCAIVGTIIPPSFFYAEETYNNGEVKKVTNLELQVGEHDIKLGDGNVITVTYQGKEYMVSITGIQNSIAYITAKYIGSADVETEVIQLKDILITAIYKDGTIKSYTADTVLGCVLVDDVRNKTKKIVKYFNLEAEVYIAQSEKPIITPEVEVPVTVPPIVITPSVLIPEPTIPSKTQAPPQILEPTIMPSVTLQPIIVTASSIKLDCNTKKIKWTTKKDVYKIYSKKDIRFVFTTKYINKIEYQLIRKGQGIKEKKWCRVKNNKIVLDKDHKSSVLYLRYIDASGKIIIKKTKGFVLDKIKPVVKGVNDKKTYKKKVTIKVSDENSGIGKILLNEKKVGTTIKVSRSGNYKLVVIDKAGNKVIKRFTMKK